jgi:hypothetical protein
MVGQERHRLFLELLQHILVAVVGLDTLGLEAERVVQVAAGTALLGAALLVMELLILAEVAVVALQMVEAHQVLQRGAQLQEQAAQV